MPQNLPTLRDTRGDDPTGAPTEAGGFDPSTSVSYRTSIEFTLRELTRADSAAAKNRAISRIHAAAVEAVAIGSELIEADDAVAKQVQALSEAVAHADSIRRRLASCEHRIVRHFAEVGVRPEFCERGTGLERKLL